MRVTVTELVQANQNVVLLIPAADYQAALTGMLRELGSLYGKCCYVSVGRSARVLFEAFQKDGIDARNFHFVDCITKSMSVRPLATEKKMPARSAEIQAEFVSNPSSLTEIDVTLFKTLAEHSIQLVFFDSLSTLLLYNDDLSVVKFAQHLMNKVRESGIRGVFVAMREDLETPLVKDLGLFADAVVDWGAEKK